LEEEKDSLKEIENEEFGELLKYTGTGFAGGLIIGALLDYFGFQLSSIGQWFVRTISGEGESIFEGIYAIRCRVRGSIGSMTEAYGWGKLFGMTIPWIIDWISRLLDIDVYGVEGFYIPYFYALSDQIGANVSGLLFLHKKEGDWQKTINRYMHHPVMVTSLAVILLVPIGLFIGRFLGFSPNTQVSTALETIVANLCWVPPLVGFLKEKFWS
jgi:hypothetical protein